MHEVSALPGWTTTQQKKKGFWTNVGDEGKSKPFGKERAMMLKHMGGGGINKKNQMMFDGKVGKGREKRQETDIVKSYSREEIISYS